MTFAAAIGAPHPVQNFRPAVTGVPHFAHFGSKAAGGVGCGEDGTAGGTASAVPQPVQNFSPGVIAAPHFEHMPPAAAGAATSGCPQETQNFNPAALSLPQMLHVTIIPPFSLATPARQRQGGILFLCQGSSKHARAEFNRQRHKNSSKRSGPNHIEQSLSPKPSEGLIASV